MVINVRVAPGGTAQVTLGQSGQVNKMATLIDRKYVCVCVFHPNISLNGMG